MISRIVHAVFEKYQFVRRFIIFWAMTVISYATYTMYSVVEQVDAQTNFLYTTTVGILSLVIAFYIKLRRDDKELEAQTLKEIKKEIKDDSS